MPFSLILMMIVALLFTTLIIVLGILSSFDYSLMDLAGGEQLDEVLFYAIIAVGGAILLSFINLQVADNPLSISLNITGVLIPIGVFVILLATRRIEPLSTLISVCLVALVAFPLTQIVSQGAIISFPLWLIPAAVAAACGCLLTRRIRREGEYSNAATAYGAGCMGMLLGGDLFHLPDLVSQGGNSLIIGAGGLTDFIFLTGVIAVSFVWMTSIASDNIQQRRGIKKRIAEY